MGKPARPPDRLNEQFTVTSAVLVQEPGEPAELGEQEVPGGQMTVATVASVRDQIRETARLFDPRGSPLITLEGGENGSVP